LKDRSFDVPVTLHTSPMDQLIYLPISLGYIVSELSREFLPQLSTKPHMATWAPIPAEPAKTRLSWVHVTKEALPSVLDACRMHETTLTTLLNALFMVSMATRLSEAKARAFSYGTPICFRHFQKAGKSDVDCNKTFMNCYAYWPFVFEQGLIAKIRQQFSDAKTNPDLDINLVDAVWDVARIIREGLLAKLKQGTKNDTVGLAKFIGDW
ncbi:Alcohol acetyltransferase, partial [Fusarium oxysporum]